jgi:hypothetical protein
MPTAVAHHASQLEASARMHIVHLISQMVHQNPLFCPRYLQDVLIRKGKGKGKGKRKGNRNREMKRIRTQKRKKGKMGKEKEKDKCLNFGGGGLGEGVGAPPHAPPQINKKEDRVLNQVGQNVFSTERCSRGGVVWGWGWGWCGVGGRVGSFLRSW